jgi:hypothetical protein
VMTAVPAEPEKPEMNSLLASHGAMYSEEWLSSEGTTGVRLELVEKWKFDHSHTVDVNLALLHEVPQPGQALRRADRLHVVLWSGVTSGLRAENPSVQRTCDLASGCTGIVADGDLWVSRPQSAENRRATAGKGFPERSQRSSVSHRLAYLTNHA